MAFTDKLLIDLLDFFIKVGCACIKLYSEVLIVVLAQVIEVYNVFRKIIFVPI